MNGRHLIKMKKIVFVLLMVIIIVGCRTIKKDNLIITINVGGTEIKIPQPKNGFSLFYNNRNDINLFNTKRSTVICMFTTKEYISSIKDRANDKLMFDTLLYISYPNKYKMLELSKVDFDKLKDYEIDTMITDINKINNTIVFFKNDSIINYNNNKTANFKIIGYFFDNLNSYGWLTYRQRINGIKLEPYLATINTIRVKNKIIEANISYPYVGIESIKWITESSESWAKAIIEANK